jgi:hypothetical protein
VAAIALFGLLRLVRKHFEEPIPEFEADHPRVEARALSAIPYRHVDEYIEIVPHLLQEEFTAQILGYCGNCGAYSIAGRHCDTCLEDMDYIACPHCGAEEFIPTWERQVKARTYIQCSSCGGKHA